MEEGFDTSNLMSEVVRLELLNTELADALRRIKNRIAQIPGRFTTDPDFEPILMRDVAQILEIADAALERTTEATKTK